MSIKRNFLYCLGLFFMAMGVTFSVKSDLGVSPINSVPYVLSILTPISQKNWIIIIFTLFVIFQVILLGKKFKKVNVLQLPFLIMFGYFVSLSNIIFGVTTANQYIFRVVLLIISIIFVAVGIVLYLKADIIPMPAEGLMMAIENRTNIEFYKIKISTDVILLILSVLISFIISGKLCGVREGSVIASIFIGKTIGFINYLLNKPAFSRLNYYLSIDKN